MARLREYTSNEAAQLAQSWLDVFGSDRASTNTKAYMWHVFSFGRFPAVAGQQALSEYQKQVCCEFIVLSNDRDAAYMVDERPTDPCFSDFCVFPPNFAWTMAFTHEDG